KDIETNKYDIVTIGAQVWMAENLRVTRYNDGTPIDLITLDAGWATIFFPAYTWYDNSASDYGALYNYYVVADTNSRNVCPTGWHVPSEAEWMNLTNFLGGISVAGGKMKESGLAHWNEPNSAATNVSGFTGLPGGFRSKSGSFFALGDKGSWWSSTGGSGEFAKLTEIFHDGETVSHTNLEKKSGYSVRCLRD
ncbi:MAG: fibrobacter succinogenes major paralogous domain-containing protein, partial [Saprospiraceae bacterium]|nr:fibrobacter succinogenes major paralogous domain-containing protein [Saprospiraceae bacterium]